MSTTHLPLAPQRRHLHRVDDLEDALLPVDPVNVVAVEGGLQQQLLDKLPEVDVGAWSGRALHRYLDVLLLRIWAREAVSTREYRLEEASASQVTGTAPPPPESTL